MEDAFNDELELPTTKFNQQLRQLLAQRKLASDALDEAVYEATTSSVMHEVNSHRDALRQEETISSAEELASRINNLGIDSQISFLVLKYGPDAVKELIQQL